MSKSKQVLELTNKGLTAGEIAKKLKTSAAYVYFVRHAAKKKSKGKAQFKSPRSRLVNDLFEMRKAMDAVESKPTKLLVQPQYEHAAMKILADNDLVNHPPHYTKGGIETIDFIEAKDLNYRLGNVIKYVSRVGKKGDPIQDLEKAAWYLQREITARKNA